MSNRYINKSISKDRYSNTNNGSTVDFVVSKNLDSLPDNRGGNGVVAPFQLINNTAANYIVTAAFVANAGAALTGNNVYSVVPGTGNVQHLYVGDGTNAAKLTTSAKYVCDALTGTPPSGNNVVVNVVFETAVSTGNISVADQTLWYLVNTSGANYNVYTNSAKYVANGKEGSPLLDLSGPDLYFYNGTDWIPY